MKPTLAIFVGLSTLALAACTDAVPAPTYAQSRAIDQDIEATHVVGPTATSPSFTQPEPNQALTPWRNEEMIDQRKAEQTGQLPQ
jgi:hypothetical protein